MDERTRRAWAGLVNYANGNATSAEIGTTVAACMGWVSAVAAFGLFDWIGATDLTIKAEEYRPGVDILLRFLCSRPKSPERESLRSPALQFLQDHGQHIGALDIMEIRYNDRVDKSLQDLGYTPSERESFKEQASRTWDNAQHRRRGQVTLAGTDLLPLGIRVPTRDYRDLADPICDFLMSEYQKYLNSVPARRDKNPRPVVPIFVCPTCDKLVMPERCGRKQYCSICTDQARAQKYREKAHADEARDYQWLYRLQKLTPDVRKIRLRIPKSKERLHEIKIRQRNSSRCQRLILDMKLNLFS